MDVWLTEMVGMMLMTTTTIQILTARMSVWLTKTVSQVYSGFCWRLVTRYLAVFRPSCSIRFVARRRSLSLQSSRKRKIEITPHTSS